MKLDYPFRSNRIRKKNKTYELFGYERIVYLVSIGHIPIVHIRDFSVAIIIKYVRVKM